MLRPCGVVTILVLSGIYSANAQEQVTKTPLTVPTITKSAAEANQARVRAPESGTHQATEAVRRTNIN